MRIQVAVDSFTRFIKPQFKSGDGDVHALRAPRFVVPTPRSLLQGPYSKVPLRVLQCACNSSQPKCAKNEYRAAMVSCTQCLYDGVNVHYETYIDIQILNEQTLKRLHWQVTNDLECFN